MSSKVNWPPEIQKRIKELRIKYNIGGTETPADAVRRGGPELPKLKEASEDHEHSMARSEIHQIDNAVKKIRKKLKGEGNLEAWVQSKITRAADYLNAASNYLESGEHGEIEESSCGDDTPEMRSRTVTSMSSSGSGRKPRKSPGELMRMLNQGEPPKKKKKKKKVTSESYLGEREMSPEEMEKEENLKGKYDDSEMKANMIAKYGKEKGTQIYFATIRKQAMKDGGDETVSEMKVRQYKKDPMEILSKLLRDIRLNRDVKQTRKGMQDTEKNIPRRLLSASFSPEELDEAKQTRAEREAEKISRASNRQRDMQRRKKYVPQRRRKKKLEFHDVDETLFTHGEKGKPNVQIHVNDPSGKRVRSLSNQEYNTYKFPAGHTPDYSEFQSAKTFTKTSSPHKKMIKQIRRQLRRNPENVNLLTARSKFDNPDLFQSHLKKYGINIPKRNIRYTGGMKGSDVGQKKVEVIKAVSRIAGAGRANMYDDATKVGRAVRAANSRGRGGSVKMKPHIVKPDEKGVSRSRPFKEDINYEELYTYLLESLVEMGYASDYDDASDILEEFDDETFVDVLSEAITAVAAPGDEGNRRIKKGPPKNLNYKSPYKKGIKKEYPKEQVELTPYDYWKSQLINEDETSEEIEDIQENDEPMTSYDFWKAYLELMEDARGRKPSQIRKTIVLKHLLAKKEQKTKTTQGAAVKNG